MKSIVSDDDKVPDDGMKVIVEPDIEKDVVGLWTWPGPPHARRATARHPGRPFAISVASCNGDPASRKSFSIVRLQVCLGRPFFLLPPAGNHNRVA